MDKGTHCSLVEVLTKEKAILGLRRKEDHSPKEDQNQRKEVINVGLVKKNSIIKEIVQSWRREWKV